MADRTWNAIDARILDEDWSVLAILVCVKIIIKCPNQYGVYKMPMGFLKRFFDGVLAEGQPTIEEAIRELTEDGVIKLYGDVVWIVNKWERIRYSKIRANRKAAIEYVVEHFPDVAPDFEAKYPLSQDVVPDKPDVGGTPDPDPDPDPEKKKKKSSGKPKRQPDLSDYLEVHIELARLYFPDAPDKELAIQVDVIKKLIRIDGYDHTEVVAIFRWLATGQDAEAEFWRGVVSSFVPLRKTKEGVKCHKFENMRKAWLKSQQQVEIPYERPPMTPGFSDGTSKKP